MKSTILFTLLATCAPLFGAVIATNNPAQVIPKPPPVPPADVSFYRAHEFSLDAFGKISTPDLNAEKTGVGLGLNYFLTQNIGFGVEASTENTAHSFVDTAGASVFYRIPVKRSAPYFFAGVWRDFEDRYTHGNAECPNMRDSRHWGMHVGGGLEHRFTRHLGVFVDARLVKDVSNGETAGQARGGVRWAF